MSVPPTPNLQNLKLHGQKSKKRTNHLRNQAHSPIRPKAHLHINPLLLQTCQSKSPKVSAKQCVFHPEKPAQYHNKENQSLNYCLECALIAQQCAADENSQQHNGTFIYTQEETHKKNCIQIFMNRVNKLKQEIASTRNNQFVYLEQSQQLFQENLQQLNSAFEDLIISVEQKHKEMSNALFEAIQKRKENVHEAVDTLNNVKDCLQRYVFDINKHYQEIIEELETNKFAEIISQYHAKIEYYEEIINDKSKNKNHKRLSPYEQINVYLPFQEIKRIIEKSNVSHYQSQCSKSKFTNHLSSKIEDNQKDTVKGSVSQRNKRQKTKIPGTENNQNHSNSRGSNQRQACSQPKNSRKTHCHIIKNNINGSKFEAKEENLEARQSYFYN